MRIDVHSPEFVYGCWDIFFSFVYFIVFLVFLPTYRPMTRFVTFFFPSLLGAGGLYLLFRGPHARTVGFALAVLFAFLCLAILALLSYVIGMFYGIYGPLGIGISAITAICAVQVIFLVGVWPIFQMRAFWPRKG